MRLLAYANPLTYAVELFRYGLLDVQELPVRVSAVLLLLLTVGAVGLAVAAFDRGAR